jgi:hypothetical protein
VKFFLLNIILLFSVGTIAQNNWFNNIIEVEKTDKICESGLDIDSCAYIPLYKSIYKWLGTPYKYA